MASSAPDSALASEAMEAFVDDDFASAFELYTKLVDAAPTRASAWIHRSATLLKLDRPAEALEDAERAVALDPDNAKAHLRRGMALHALDRPADARTAFERGRALDPMSKQLLSWIAKCDDALDTRVAPSSSASGASSAPAPPSPPRRRTSTSGTSRRRTSRSRCWPRAWTPRRLSSTSAPTRSE